MPTVYVGSVFLFLFYVKFYIPPPPTSVVIVMRLHRHIHYLRTLTDLFCPLLVGKIIT